MHNKTLFKKILYSNHSRRKANKKLTLAGWCFFLLGFRFTNGETWVRSHLERFSCVCFFQCVLWLCLANKSFFFFHKYAFCYRIENVRSAGILKSCHILKILDFWRLVCLWVCLWNRFLFCFVCWYLYVVSCCLHVPNLTTPKAQTIGRISFEIHHSISEEDRSGCRHTWRISLFFKKNARIWLTSFNFNLTRLIYTRLHLDGATRRD